ncbi:MAG: type III-A CRISPR-associated RAMP protein Csm3 [Terriglobia bacterium]|jgi:CRISPR-associated protein Csm3
MYLDKHEEITGTIHCLSGVRVGGNNNVIEIGALDNPIIRNPISNLPYLPGSSIKGKMRSSLELSLRPGAPLALTLPGPTMKPVERDGRPIVPTQLNPCSCGRCVICKLFGSGDPKRTFEPSRLIFRDCLLTQRSLKELEDAAGSSGVFFAEIKPGVRMNRATNTVASGAFFNFERVPEGTEFNFELVLRLYGDLDNGDARADYRKVIAFGLRLVEKEGIGGKISAGYGKVQFRDPKWNGEPWDFRKEQ